MSLERECVHEAVYLKSEALSRACIPVSANPSLLSPWPLNCFLEAGDFGRGDKEGGMKHSGCLSMSVSLREAREVLLSWDHGSSSYLAQASDQQGWGDAASKIPHQFKPPSTLSAAQQMLCDWQSLLSYNRDAAAFLFSSSHQVWISQSPTPKLRPDSYISL